MNKLLVIPIGILICMAVVGVFYDPTVNMTGHVNEQSYSVWDDTNQTWNNVTVNNGNDNVDLTLQDGAVALLMIAIVAGCVAGISFLGSGLSTMSQLILFKSIVYGGLWGILSYGSYDMILTLPSYGAMLWMALTMVYAIGFAFEVA